MIPKECKRLAEVDFPIAEVSKHAAREKSIRHGHPSTLHLWWARRPLASSRAVLMALLLPDPCDPHCPQDFKKQAREILGEVRQTPKDNEDLQKALLWFIGSFANWDLSSNPTYLRVARNLVRAAHPEETPLVVDPFAGGGSIPLEALRIGCEAFASDLNPVACLILKVMLEDIPRQGPELAVELRKAGREIKAKVKNELADLFPSDPNGATPIAYLWARTVRCESPNCGAEIPLMRSMWLCKKTNRKRALRTKIMRPNSQPPRVEFEIFEPGSEKEVAPGTVARAKATCLCCSMVLPPERVRVQLLSQMSGADTIFDPHGNRIGGARMTAVVTIRPNEQGRFYRLATNVDYAAVYKAQVCVTKIHTEWDRGGRQGLCPVPDEPTPKKRTHRAVGSQLSLYGITTFGDLFTARQKVALVVLGRAICSSAYTDATIPELLACAFSRVAMSDMSCTRWNAVAEKMQHTFGRQALPMVWDFAEVVPTAKAPGNWQSGYEIIGDVIDSAPRSNGGQVQSADATNHPLPDQAAGIWFTDPPYYDAIPYADLSDFFLVWLKRTLPGHSLLHDPFDLNNPLSPKTQEVVQCEKVKDANGAPKDGKFYERAMANAFAEGRRVLRRCGVGSVVFAHKTTEGWEALLSGMIRSDWTITGSWPIATEMGSRLNARETASLATSVHLICRPRSENAPVGDWADVLRALPTRVKAWINRLQSEGIRGSDLVFACIGPALEIFSRYRAVETAEGREVSLAEYLEKVWEVVGRAALEQVLGSSDPASSALEVDSRLTAIFLWTLQSTEGPKENGKKEEDDDEKIAKFAARGFSLPFDVVRRFAQPLGIDLPTWEGRIIDTEKGIVRLLPVSERTKILFGEDGASAAAFWIASDTRGDMQGMLFPNMEATAKQKTQSRGKKALISGDTEIQSPDATTLDRVHAAMLLQASGQANALRKLIRIEQDRGPDFLRLANALSALYPKGCEEKRLLDAMLLALPR